MRSRGCSKFHVHKDQERLQGVSEPPGEVLVIWGLYSTVAHGDFAKVSCSDHLLGSYNFTGLAASSHISGSFQCSIDPEQTYNQE